MDEVSSQEPADEIRLGTLFRVLWKYKYLVATVTTLGAVAALILALTAIPIYRAEAVITEVREGGMGGGGALTSQLGGLASLAGLNLAGSNTARSAQAVLKSRHLVEEFVKRNNLLPELFPKAQRQPTLWLAVKRFQEGLLRISEDTRQSKTTVAVEWTDPAVAARWANALVVLANELIRARALEESNRNVAYLKEQIARTNVVELQRVMYNLIESETKTLMLANARAEYAFVIVDPAVPPEIRISPRRTLMVLGGIAAGFSIGLFLAWSFDAIRRLRGQPLS